MVRYYKCAQKHTLLVVTKPQFFIPQLHTTKLTSAATTCNLPTGQLQAPPTKAQTHIAYHDDAQCSLQLHRHFPYPQVDRERIEKWQATPIVYTIDCLSEVTDPKTHSRATALQSKTIMVFDYQNKNSYKKRRYSTKNHSGKTHHYTTIIYIANAGSD